MRYISLLYDEILVRELAKMQLTGATRVREPILNRSRLAAAAATTPPDTVLNFSAV